MAVWLRHHDRGSVMENNVARFTRIIILLFEVLISGGNGEILLIFSWRAHKKQTKIQLCISFSIWIRTSDFGQNSTEIETDFESNHHVVLSFHQKQLKPGLRQKCSFGLCQCARFGASRSSCNFEKKNTQPACWTPSLKPCRRWHLQQRPERTCARTQENQEPMHQVTCFAGFSVDDVRPTFGPLAGGTRVHVALSDVPQDAHVAAVSMDSRHCVLHRCRWYLCTKQLNLPCRNLNGLRTEQTNLIVHNFFLNIWECVSLFLDKRVCTQRSIAKHKPEIYGRPENFLIWLSFWSTNQQLFLELWWVHFGFCKPSQC